jgi:hypothetical protein
MRPIPILLVALATPALAQDEALENCRRLAEPTARLACYDAIPTRSRGAAPAPTTAPIAPAGSAASAAAAVPPAAPSVDTFGLPQRAREEQIQSITTSVGKDFAGWGQNERIRLDNGQVWQVVDGTVVAVRPGARQVVVRRGTFGSFFLDFEGVTQSPRVRRIQ